MLFAMILRPTHLTTSFRSAALYLATIVGLHYPHWTRLTLRIWSRRVSSISLLLTTCKSHQRPLGSVVPCLRTPFGH